MLLSAEHISKNYGMKQLLQDVSLYLSEKEKIGILGVNGMGKSTLLNIIAGKLAPDSGIVDVGSTVKIGYFMQECGELPMDRRVYDFISDISSEIKTNEGTFSASQMLERFLFTSDLQYTTIVRLSGGERRRLYLLSILMEAPNILLLDEPTNDLDIETLTILEDYLESFPGAVIAVSHDRYFLDKMAAYIFEVSEDGKITSYMGNYSDYSDKKSQEQPALTAKKAVEATAPKAEAVQKPKKLKFTFKEQYEFESIDEVIA
ncbi:MAG: ATP-binding cassette domain-containing protein, partial [Angelakisella sp.]